MTNAHLPNDMQAIEIVTTGDQPKLAMVTLPCPAPKDDEVLVRVHAAGVNRPDLMQVAGLYPPPPGAPDTPGLELSGEIVAFGKSVKDWAIGDRICALVAGGAYAQYAIVPAAQCLPVPAGLSMAEAAALPETIFTVWQNLFDKAGLQKGETVLIHGGSSGIGTIAIQLAKAFGATVITTAGTAAKCGACRDLGADYTINYREQDFVEEVNRITEGKGANVILDMVAGDYIGRDFKCAAMEARIQVIAFLNGPKAETNFVPLLTKRLTLRGSTLRAQPVEIKGRYAKQLREKVWPMIERGDIRPVMHRIVAFDQVQAAHDILRDGSHIGKVVLDLGVQ
jgi:putative PIG3 family NAD(P)H quinone oxidoreductase